MKRFAMLAVASGISITAFSQQFIQRTGTQNVLNGIDIGTNSAPAFIDIDNDLDNDLFVGTGSGAINYLKNTGSSINPVFALQTTQNNPFGLENFVGAARPSFVDIDKDGDYDAFVGSVNGDIQFLKNQGTKEAPVFVLQTAENPLAQVATEFQSSCWFVDIDGDLDMDVFVGGDSQTILFYKNSGSATIPAFSLTNTPLVLVSPTTLVFPVFVDIDKDGDQDVFVSSSGNLIAYYENTGSKISAAFTRQTGPLNPLNSVSQQYPVPAFADLDLDGDLDAIIGQLNGTFTSYQNNTINLPLKLIAFTATAASNISITWKTAEEKNTSSFHLEKSNNGIDFTTFKQIAAFGSGNNTYSATDLASNAIHYYRLKMFDLDGSYTLSQVIHASQVQPASGIKLYPNPAAHQLHIDFSDQQKSAVQVTIFNLAGEMEFRTELKPGRNTISVESLTPGIYLLKLPDGSGRSFTKK